MNNEEPITTAAANETVGTTGTPIPEQTQIAMRCIPRALSILSLIHQWQPMGIRVVIDLPFVGNDHDLLFILRNGPFIPRWDYVYNDTNPEETNEKNEDPEAKGSMKVYAWNNMRNVYLGFSYDKPRYSKSGVHITQYDYPPILATLAACFRRWRGDLQYRFRVVAGFATQGYLIACPFKNIFSPIGKYDEYDSGPAIVRQDTSLREGMINSYVMSDTSMFRHLEVTMPYEYPAPWYDQYQWMSRRVSPKSYATNKPSKDRNSPHNIITTEPHGDNWLGLGMRGTIQTTETGGQVIFELEYRAVEGFQFADPGLPINSFTEPYSDRLQTLPKPLDLIKTVPDGDLTSDGYFVVSKRGGSAALSRVARTLGAALPSSTPRPVNHNHRHPHQAGAHIRIGREIDPDMDLEQIDSIVPEIKIDDRELRSIGRRDQEFSY